MDMVYFQKKIIVKLFFIALVVFNYQELRGDSVKFDYRNEKESFWKKKLPKEVYEICRKRGTEPPSSGIYDQFYEEGTYYCACCGADYSLFSSKTKYDSKTGWPSFYASIEGHVIERPDPDDSFRALFFTARIEVICARCHSHLGHVFDDGPPPTNKRYCLNSLALHFIPKSLSGS